VPLVPINELQAGKASNIEKALKLRRIDMAEHLYKVVEIIGASSESFEKAAKAAVEAASEHLKDLRIAEVVSMDMQVSDGKVSTYRTKVKLSFKYHPEMHRLGS
jgi:flavin-binding protein dodecin